MLWVKVIALFLLVPGIADVLIPWWILNRAGKFSFTSFGVWQGIGAFFILIGLAMVIWVCQAFVRHGHGTPAPFDPPHNFVTTGLYRWVRNPLYLGAAVLIPLGEGFFFESPWLLLYIAVLVILLQVYIVYVEEPALVRRFGRPYKKYLRTVSRWIPRNPRD